MTLASKGHPWKYATWYSFITWYKHHNIFQSKYATLHFLSFSDIVIKALYMKIYNPTTPPPNISYMNHQNKLTYISPECEFGMERYSWKWTTLHLSKLWYKYQSVTHSNKLRYIFQACGIDIKRLSMKTKTTDVTSTSLLNIVSKWKVHSL